MKIAIVKLSAMGDIIHAMVALQFIKAQRPDIKIDWIVEEVFAPILENNPDIQNIITVNLKSLKKKKSLLFHEISNLLKIRKNNYDLVIDAQGLLKSAIVSKIIGKNVAGFDKDSIRESIASNLYSKKVSIGYDQNIIERNIKLFSSSLELKIEKEDIIQKNPFLYYKNRDFKTISQTQPNILFIVGASTKNKIYPKENFLQLAKKLHEKNIIIVWANEFEKEAAEFIAKSPNVKIEDTLSLNDLKALISKVDLVIGGDTGPTHMAWGLNKPSITIFGNTPAYRNTYITKINVTVKSDSVINIFKINKNDFSIKFIDVDVIIKECKNLLNQIS